MSSRDEHILESQNDQRLDELHSKIRTLRHVTIDINNDVERQNLTLDETGNSFGTLSSSLTQAARKATRVFGQGGKNCKMMGYIIVAVVGLWFLFKLGRWWIGAGQPAT